MIALRYQRAVAYKTAVANAGAVQYELLRAYIRLAQGNGIGNKGVIANFQQRVGNAAGGRYFGIFTHFGPQRPEKGGDIYRSVNRVQHY